MKLNKVLLGIAFAVNTFSVLAADSAPVYDLNSKAGSMSYADQAKEIKNLSRQLDARNRAQIALQQQVDELQTEVNNLRGVTELHTHQLSQVLERQRELYQELDRRVNEALKTTPATTAYQQPNTDNQVNYSNNLTENEAYDRAVNLVLKDKLYEKAIVEFRQFNQKYPKSTYAANSHYWLGQLLFNKGELAEAEKEFTVVVTQFTDSSKRPDSLLKLAMVAQKQNSKTKAITLYRQLIKEYPSSTAAQLAKPRLDSLT